MIKGNFDLNLEKWMLVTAFLPEGKEKVFSDVSPENYLKVIIKTFEGLSLEKLTAQTNKKLETANQKYLFRMLN